MNIQEAKQALDKVIDKARVHLYKPIQVAEILHRDKVYDIIAEEDEATQILNVVAESIVEYKRKTAKI